MIMDGCLDLEGLKIPRPKVYSEIDLAVMCRHEKVCFEVLSLIIKCLTMS